MRDCYFKLNENNNNNNIIINLAMQNNIIITFFITTISLYTTVLHDITCRVQLVGASSIWRFLIGFPRHLFTRVVVSKKFGFFDFCCFRDTDRADQS